MSAALKDLLGNASFLVTIVKPPSFHLDAGGGRHMRRTHMATPNYECPLHLSSCRDPFSCADLSKLDCAPMAAAISPSQQSPENVSLCWRPWLAVQAVAGDGTCDFDTSRIPVPYSVR